MLLTKEQEATKQLCEADKSLVYLGIQEDELVYGEKTDKGGWNMYYVDVHGWISGFPREEFFNLEKDGRKLRKLYNWRFKLNAKKKAEEEAKKKAEQKERNRQRRLEKKKLKARK